MPWTMTLACCQCALAPPTPRTAIGATDKTTTFEVPSGWVQIFDPLSDNGTRLRVFCPECKNGLGEEAIARTNELLEEAGIYGEMVRKRRQTRSS